MVRRLAPFLTPLLIVLAADQASKWWARGALWNPLRDVTLVPGWLVLTPIENRGVAFGLFTEYGGVLALLVLLLLGVIAIRNRHEFLRADPSLKIPAGLIIGGGIGNVIDRLHLGYVVDFIKLPKLPIFQVFNVADAAITVGGALLVLALLLADRREKAERRMLDAESGAASAASVASGEDAEQNERQTPAVESGAASVESGEDAEQDERQTPVVESGTASAEKAESAQKVEKVER